MDYQTSVLLGALGMGALMGLIPGIAGIIKKKFALGIVGFLACVAGSYLLGLFLSIPLCIAFTFIILYLSQKSTAKSTDFTSVSEVSPNTTKFCPNCGSSINENQTFCVKCGNKVR